MVVMGSTGEGVIRREGMGGGLQRSEILRCAQNDKGVVGSFPWSQYGTEVILPFTTFRPKGLLRSESYGEGERNGKRQGAPPSTGAQDVQIEAC
jgi:hypothetical protein